MKKIIFFIFIFLFACSTTEEEQHKNGYGELIREGYPTEINPFNILKKTSKGLVKTDAPIIIAYDASDYLPLTSVDIGYIFSLKVPAEHYTEDEYLISLRALTKDWKECGEAKEVIFYRFAEEEGTVEYSSYIRKGQGIYLYFSERELPSHDWYKVLNVGDKREGFRLEGRVVE